MLSDVKETASSIRADNAVVRGWAEEAEEKAILEKGYCTLLLFGFPENEKYRGGGVKYRVWSRLIDKGFIRHHKSNLGEDALCPYEIYRVTKAGREAIND